MDLLTMAEVAELLRTPMGTLYQWRSRGKGPSSVNVGRRVLYERSDVEQWIRDLRDAEARNRSAGHG